MDGMKAGVGSHQGSLAAERVPPFFACEDDDLTIWQIVVTQSNMMKLQPDHKIVHDLNCKTDDTGIAMLQTSCRLAVPSSLPCWPFSKKLPAQNLRHQAKLFVVPI